MWLKVVGVPCHAWKEEVFRDVVGQVGSFIKVDDCTSGKKRFDVGRVLVSTSVPEAINKVTKVMVNKTIFSIRLMEETFGELYLSLNKHWENFEIMESSSEATDIEADCDFFCTGNCS